MPRVRRFVYKFVLIEFRTFNDEFNLCFYVDYFKKARNKHVNNLERVSFSGYIISSSRP